MEVTKSMAARDKAFGAILAILAVLLGAVYGYALFFGFALLALEIVVSLGLAAILLIVIWMGYTIATTPSIEEIEAAVKGK